MMMVLARMGSDGDMLPRGWSTMRRECTYRRDERWPFTLRRPATRRLPMPFPVLFTRSETCHKYDTPSQRTVTPATTQ